MDFELLFARRKLWLDYNPTVFRSLRGPRVAFGRIIIQSKYY